MTGMASSAAGSAATGSAATSATGSALSSAAAGSATNAATSSLWKDMVTNMLKTDGSLTGDIMKLTGSNGGSGTTVPESGGVTDSLKQLSNSQDSKGNKGGWLGLGLFGNDQYNPSASTYQPQMGGKQAELAKPKHFQGIPLAMQY